MENQRLQNLLKSLAQKNDITTKQAAQQYVAMLESMALEFTKSLLTGDPTMDDTLAVKKAWHIAEAFAAERMQRGENLIDSLEEK